MKKLYNIVIATFAIISIIFVILDLCQVINLNSQPFKTIDNGILITFALDYAVRFYKSDNRKSFFKNNIFDLIAIIPFNSIFSAFRAFRLFRLLKLTKLAKLTRVLRATAFLGIIKHRLNGILKTNGFIYVLYANIVLILASSVIMMFAEKQSFPNALWWSIVTCTTVGYGDISPSTPIGRVIAVILMIFGIGLIGMLTGAITTYFTANRSKDAQKECDEINEMIEQMDESQKQKLAEIAKIILK